MSDADHGRGLYRKYFVQRLDERDAGPGVVLSLMAMEAGAPESGTGPFGKIRQRPALAPPKHERCRYFVLDLDHDAFAAPALLAYADACAAEYPALAADLRALTLAALAQHRDVEGGER